jgi:hypothetical protein
MAFYTGNNAPRGNAPLAQTRTAVPKHAPRRGSAKPPGRTTAGPAPKVDAPKIWNENPGIVKRPDNVKVF